MVKIARKDGYNAMLKRCEGARSNVAGASVRIMTSHFVAHLSCRTLLYVDRGSDEICVCVCVCVCGGGT